MSEARNISGRRLLLVIEMLVVVGIYAVAILTFIRGFEEGRGALVFGACTLTLTATMFSWWIKKAWDIIEDERRILRIQGPERLRELRRSSPLFPLDQRRPK